MRILLAGNSFFSKKLANKLNEFDLINNYYYIRTDDSFFGRLTFLAILPFCNVVYHLGGELYSSKLINVALWFRKKVVMHWIGSDVSIALDKFSTQKINNKYVNLITHYCEVSWIQSELISIGVEADIVTIASVKNAKIEELKSPFSIFTYVGKGREKFYGIDWLISLAFDFPDIPIVVAGISNYYEISKMPSNIQFVGWVDNMSDYYKKSSIYLRLTKHDGLAFSVIEALSFARHVGYTKKYPGTVNLESYEDLKKFVGELYSKMLLGDLKPNEFGCDFVGENHIESKVFNILSRRLINL
jgi:hypothetical protein